MQIVPLAAVPFSIPVLAQWLHREWDYYSERAWVRELAGRRQADRIPLTLVALEAGQPIGTASLTTDDMETRPELTPWLASVLVSPAARGRGVGSALVRAVVARAAALGFDTLYLFTAEQMALYSGLGWEVLERTKYFEDEVTIMHLRLKQE